MSSPEAGSRVVVAMSGGVDSSVAAALAVEGGYEVIGVMLRLWSHEATECNRQNLCCTDEAVDTAREVASTLGFPFYTLDVSADFRRHVVDTFVRSYAAGSTPNPCLICNERIRFGYLLGQAMAMGAAAMATGHYARITRDDSPERGYHLWRGSDTAKDQSYVLYMLGQQELARLWLPLGELNKDDTRSIARRHGLSAATRSESQDLCFTGGLDYREFLRAHAPTIFVPGDVVDEQGRCLGRHIGLAAYTIGQRKGLGIAVGSPQYVLEKDATRNLLVVGPRSSLGRASFVVTNVSFVSGHWPLRETAVQVQVRYSAPAVPATLRPIGEDAVTIDSTTDFRGITPGQAAVFYRGQECLGGGLINR